jgi:GNAT superfamily N-acetyltransferase
MEIIPFTTAHLAPASNLFARSFREQRQATPVLPARLEDPSEVQPLLERMFDRHAGLAAQQNGELLGYLLWLYIENFRNASRKAAYCPVYAHGVTTGDQELVYKALYRAASEQWAEAGCEVHAITLPAHDHSSLQTWFWNGFGLGVVDAIRACTPLQITPPGDVTIRQAEGRDAALLADLERDHWHHYLAAPVFMHPTPPSSAAEFLELVQTPGSSAWLAFAGDRPSGYLRLEPGSQGATEIAAAATTVAITGAYTVPEQRGRGIAAALLDAALRYSAVHGSTACSVDFESFNPEAAAFWMRYFHPICYSLLRTPERSYD